MVYVHPFWRMDGMEIVMLLLIRPFWRIGLNVGRVQEWHNASNLAYEWHGGSDVLICPSILANEWHGVRVQEWYRSIHFVA
jgi:hypothetical protein